MLQLSVRELPHGSMLYHISNHSRLTRIQAVMRTGSIHEGDDAGCGLSHFLEHMLFQGCKRYPGNSASEKIHTLGGDCNAYTTFDHTAYYVEVPTGKFAEAADIITSMISEPLFPEEKFISEKEVIAREADMIFDRPAHRLVQQLWQGLFPSHPARMPIIGFPDKIATVTRDTMQQYYLRRYGAMRCHWLVTGELDTDYVQQILSENLAGFPRGNLSEVMLPQEAEQPFEVRKCTEFADPLTRIACGIRAPRASEHVTPALDLLAGILGGSDSSYLVNRFLYQDQLAVAVDAEFDATSFGSVLAVSAACEPSKAEILEQGIRSELARIRKCGITAEDLKREKLQQRMTLYQQLKFSSSTMNIVNSLRMNFGNAECLDNYLGSLEAVTLDEINYAAQEYFDPRRFVWSIVKPAGEKSFCSTADLPQPEKTVKYGKLSNQVKYVFVERSNIPLDSLSVLLPAGPVWEQSPYRGISQMLAKMLATGPDDMEENSFYEYLDSRGIDLDASCGNNTLSIEVTFPPEVRQEAGDILRKLLINPRLSGTAFERVRSNLIERLNSKLMEPGFVALQQAKRRLFGNHAGGNSRFESVEELEAVTPEKLREFYLSRLDKTLVNFGATVSPQMPDVSDYMEKLSTALAWSEKALTLPAPATAEDFRAADRNYTHCINLPREQSTVVCALPGVFAHSREYYMLLILDAALNGLSSNLFLEVREKRSLAYSTGTLVNCGLVQGIIALHAGVKPENASAAMQCLKDEISRIGKNGLEAGEFAAAQQSALSALARQLESVDAQLQHAQLALFYSEEPEKSLRCQDLLSSISRDECNAVLKKLFNDPPIACVAAGGDIYSQINQGEKNE